MRKQKRIFAGLLLLAALAATTPAQRKADLRARGLFIRKSAGADAMRVLILKAEGNSMVPASPGQEFRRGDEIKVAFESNFEGFVYIVNLEPNGRKCILFPFAGQSDNSVRPGQRYELPSGDGTIAFDEERGTEVMQVIMSRERIGLLDAALKNPKCSDPGVCCDATQPDSEAQPKSNITVATVNATRGGLAKSTAAKPLPGVRSRDIIFGAGKDKGEGSFVAVSAKKGSSGKLQTGQVAVFEIRLKHN